MSTQDLINILSQFPPDTPVTVMIDAWEAQLIHDNILVCEDDGFYPTRLVLDTESKANPEFYIPHEEWLEDNADG
jgi:hypothetical protein